MLSRMKFERNLLNDMGYLLGKSTSDLEEMDYRIKETICTVVTLTNCKALYGKKCRMCRAKE